MISISDKHPTTPGGTEVFHVINPKVKSWSGGIATVILSLFKQQKMRLVAFQEWLALLRESAGNPVDVEVNPAVRLIDFLDDVSGEAQGARVLRTEKAEAASKVLGGIGAVNRGWVKNWMRQWGIGK